MYGDLSPTDGFRKIHSVNLFCVLSMAAEMSTGCLAMMNVFQRKPPVSMLVVVVESHYFKKAVGVTVSRAGTGICLRRK
jgi:hypothetical protein